MRIAPCMFGQQPHDLRSSSACADVVQSPPWQPRFVRLCAVSFDYSGILACTGRGVTPILAGRLQLRSLVARIQWAAEAPGIGAIFTYWPCGGGGIRDS